MIQKHWRLFLFLFLVLDIPIVYSLTVKQSEAMQMLHLIAFGNVAELKYKIGGEPGGEYPELDDSEWETTFPGFKWEQSNTNVWFRSHIKIPDKLGGFSLVGQKMTLFLYIDNGGDVFVNGDSLGSFEWGTAEFVISENLQAGDSFLLAVRGINKPGWGKVSEYRIEFSNMQKFQRKLQKKVWGLIIAQRVAEKLSSKPQYWLEQIDLIANNLIQCEAFKKGSEEDFLVAFEEQGRSLLPLKEEVQDKFTLYCAGYSHIDLAWKWPRVESIEVIKNTSESVFNIINRFPAFRYSMGQAHAYEWLEKYEPALFRTIQQKVKEGKWEIIGGQWVEPDGNLPSGESFVRQSLYGKRYFRNKFGVDVKICWMPDSFGFNWNLPQILARSGIDAFITTRVDLHDTRNFPHRLFWWESADGSKVLTYIPRDGYMHDLNGEQLIDFLAAEKEEFNSGKELVIYGVGNHGGGPTMEMLERARLAQTAPAFPELKLSTSQEFFNSLSEVEKLSLPVWSSELYLERFRGCYTSQARTKKQNRQGQVLIKSAEKIASLASLYDYQYPRTWIFNVWRTILFNQFHDILPGTSINAVYHDTELDYAGARELAGLITKRSFETLVKKIDTRGPGKALVIFNPLSWSRSGPVLFKLDDQEMSREWQITDERGNTIPTQKVDKLETSVNLLFMANNIPSFGYAVYHLDERKPAASNNHLKFNRTEMENAYLHVKIDKVSGFITEIYDRMARREVLAIPQGNKLQILHDLAQDAWNMRFDDTPVVNLKKAREVTLEEFGPVRTTIKIVQSFAGEKKIKPTEDFPSSFFTQHLSLYADLPYLEVRNQVMWWENDKVLKVAFPVNIQSKTARYEIPYGSISRSTGFETPFEKARYEVPAQRWADLSDDQYGVALINDSNHGYDIKENIMRLTLLRASGNPDPLADRGYHQFNYALYPHKGDYISGQVVQRSIEFNEPFIVIKNDVHPGELGKSHSFLQISPSTVVLNVLKMAEDDNDLVIRVVETAGLSERVIIKFDRHIGSVNEVNLTEDIIADIKPQSKSFIFNINPYEIRSFKVHL